VCLLDQGELYCPVCRPKPVEKPGEENKEVNEDRTK